ncbi:MAG TPA: polysaccharide biosynthesis tyrosine autokinase [Streptosporangiaceae bacterium]
MEIIDYFRLLRRNWALIAGCAALAVAAAWLVTVRTTPRYAASVTIFVAGRGTGGASAYEASLLSEERIKSYAHLLTTDRLIGALVREQPGRTAEQLRREISAGLVPGTVLLRATVRDPSPARAQAIANALGAGFIQLVDELERPAAGGVPPFKVSIVDRARLPAVPDSPNVPANLAIGLLAGLAAGVGAGVLREALDTSVKTVERLREIAGGPVLGVIGATGEHPPTGPSEDFRFLGTNLRFAGGGRPVGSVVVTAARPGDGASSTACGLAVALAHAGQRVILVDGSLRAPHVARYLGVDDAGAGLAGVLRGRTDLDGALRRWRDTTLSVLPCGPVPAAVPAHDLLGAPRMGELVDELRERADIVIVDAPPLLSAPDAAVLARACDGAIVVARYGRTGHDQLRRAAEQLHTVDARLIGTVLNRAPARPGAGPAPSPAPARLATPAAR